MSNVGPPGGGSSDPWDARPGDGYPPSRYAPTAPQYDPPTQRYEQPADWEPPRPKRGRGPLVAVLVMVLLLAGAAAFWAFRRGASTPASGTDASASSAAGPTREATGSAGTATTPASSSDPRFVKAGQCVRNDGSTEQPQLVMAECGPQTYEVLIRIEGPTSGKRDAESKCAKVAGYTNWFFFDSELDTLDFVLCLKQR